MSRRPTRVLCVDDDPDMLFLLRTILTLPGWDVREACDGHSAITTAGDGDEPEMAVVDYMMPDMDGLEVATALRADHPDCAIVLFTAHATIARDAAHHPAVDAFVSKDQVMRIDEVLSAMLPYRASA